MTRQRLKQKTPVGPDENDTSRSRSFLASTVNTLGCAGKFQTLRRVIYSVGVEYQFTSKNTCTITDDKDEYCAWSANHVSEYNEVASQAPFFSLFRACTWDCKRLLASYAMTGWRKYRLAAYRPSPKPVFLSSQFPAPQTASLSWSPREN